MRYKKNDEVIITIGRDKGKKGKIDKVIVKKNQVLVNGINLSKRHKKSQGQNSQGGIIDIIKPLSVSKIQLVCPKCRLPTRVGYRVDNKEKSRICKKCKENI